TDTNGLSSIATVSITIDPVNDIPVANLVSATTDEDNSITLDVLANSSDVEGDTLSIKSITNGSHGTTSIVDGKIVYTPTANFNGTDTISYTISDGNGGEITKELTVNVNPVNDIPVATVTTATTDEDNSITIDVLASASDVDGDTLTIKEVSNGSHGTTSIVEDTNGNKVIQYTPNSNYFGTDTITYTISDGNGGEITKELTVNVNSVNDVPVANLVSATTDEDNIITIDVLASASDVDGDILSIASVTNGTNGTATIIDDANGNKVIQYVPNANYFGTDTITYTISDGNGGETTKSISVVINSVNDNPIATDDSVSVNEDSTIIINTLNNDTDIEDELSSYNKENINIVAAAAFGVVVLNADGSFAYTPNANFNGNDSFTYNITDSDGATSNTATVHINVNSINDAPIISGDAKSQDVYIGDNFVYNLGNDLAFSDVEGDNIQLSIKLADGSDLPSWLTFDSNTKTLSGIADNDVNAGLLELQVIASDGNSETTESFNLMISKEIEVNQALLDRINVIDIQDIDGIFRGHAGEMDIIRTGSGDDIIEYNQDSSWTQSNLTALNVYSNDRLELIGLNRTDDAFDGGSGTDTLNLTDGNDAIFLDDAYTDNPSASGNRLNSIEIINGNDGNDIIDLSSLRYSYGNVELNGGDGNDVLWSNDGDDTLNGGTGNDNIQGGRGDDILNGDAGNDILKGYDDNDAINGGEGVDRMWGGNGNDIFKFDSLEDSRIDSSDVNTMDTIYDFTQGQDTLEFDSSLGFDSIAFEGANGSTLGYYHEDGNTIIRNEDNDFSIKLIGEINLDNSDFGF
ncbi:MAG: tandem-95 repeat protein, partial [Rickettsiales bacterium]|nr:tandem-95 repeat protein [Rickettsiales bacterium]